MKSWIDAQLSQRWQNGLPKISPTSKDRLIEILSVNLQKAIELLEGGEILVEITR